MTLCICALFSLYFLKFSVVSHQSFLLLRSKLNSNDQSINHFRCLFHCFVFFRLLVSQATVFIVMHLIVNHVPNVPTRIRIPVTFDI